MCQKFPVCFFHGYHYAGCDNKNVHLGCPIGPSDPLQRVLNTVDLRPGSKKHFSHIQKQMQQPVLIIFPCFHLRFHP